VIAFRLQLSTFATKSADPEALAVGRESADQGEPDAPATGFNKTGIRFI
jgi:hypothetical protein